MSQATPWQPLDWDTRFFGFGVARLLATPGSRAELEHAVRSAREAGLRLLYATCDTGNAHGQELLAGTGALLVDLKRTYAARIPAEPLPSPVQALTLPIWPPALQRRQLRALAWQAAEHSRFRIDPRMPSGAWRRMYSAWIANSLNGNIADRVLAFGSGDSLSAMVTVALRSPHASIGLLAVQHEQRGRGLGRQLVHAAFDTAHQAGLDAIRVVTQGGNRAACRTYEACGMYVTDEQCIFHLWTD